MALIFFITIYRVNALILQPYGKLRGLNSVVWQARHVQTRPGELLMSSLVLCVDRWSTTGCVGTSHNSTRCVAHLCITHLCVAHLCVAHFCVAHLCVAHLCVTHLGVTHLYVAHLCSWHRSAAAADDADDHLVNCWLILTTDTASVKRLYCCITHFHFPCSFLL